MTISFPCNECGAPVVHSSHPDRHLCPTCGRVPEPLPPGERPAFAVEPQEQVSRADVLRALKEMAGDKRLTNQPVTAIFRRAAELIEASEVRDGQATTDYEPLRAGRIWTQEEAQKRHRKSMMEAGIDPIGEIGLMLRASFLAGWKVARGET